MGCTTICRRLAALLLGCAAALCAQTAPVFDVATVKPAAPQTPGNNTSGVSTSKGLMDARNVTLKRLIMGAYSVGPRQVVGAPEWVATERFDLLAKTLEPIDDDAVMMAMLQRLMADRFRLKVHRETRTMSAYLLEVGKAGPLMEKAPGGESSTNTASDDVGTTLTARNTDMKLFAQVLAREMDLPVVNETGLDGPFNFKLHWTPDVIREGARGVKPGEEVSIFTAIQEQLGLKLHAGKGPVEVVVVDRVEEPSAN